MSSQQGAANRVTALLTAMMVAVFIIMVAATPIVATTVPDPWTRRSRHQGAGARDSSSKNKASIDDSHQRLEEQTSRETREIFGEDFCEQLEMEREAVQIVHQLKARVGREAGCPPTSPLASALLGSDAAADDEVAGEGGRSTQDGIGGPMADWLR